MHTASSETESVAWVVYPTVLKVYSGCTQDCPGHSARSLRDVHDTRLDFVEEQQRGPELHSKAEGLSDRLQDPAA